MTFTWIRKAYNFCVTIPDRFYPFSEEIEGERVRWQAAYDQALAKFQEEYGYGRYGARLIAYRGLFHVIGASLFILFSALVTRELFDTDRALYVLFVFAVIALAYQEAFIQKRTHGQHFLHSIFDWFSWVIPMGIYIYVHTHGITLSQFF
jgi:hypothetical protein